MDTTGTSSISRIKTSLQDIRKSLEKYITQEDQNEKIYDILNILEQESMTAKLIKESKLGKVVNQVKEKYEKISNDISTKAKHILIHWKKLIEASNVTDKHHIDHHKIDPAQFKTDDNADIHDDTELDKLKVIMGTLPTIRRSIYQIFYNLLIDSTDNLHSMSIAIKIEDALNRQSCNDATSKSYNNKAKSLLFNLNKNNVLRTHIINGSITCHDLVNLSASELATHEQKLEREKLKIESFDAHRSDWLEANKATLQIDNDIDPNNIWLYEEDNDNKSEPDTDPPDI